MATATTDVVLVIDDLLLLGECCSMDEIFGRNADRVMVKVNVTKILLLH